MKKFILVSFLAVGMMSFSSNLDVKKVEVFSNTCTLVAQLAYNLAISEGADHPTAVQASNIAYSNCQNSIQR